MNEQQRHADWAAAHQPETSTEELSRIARDHPEFMPAIMAHQNAPGATSQYVAQLAPGQQAPHSQAQSFPQQAYPQPQPQPQPQPFAHPAANQLTGYASDPTNKLAYAALIVALASSIASLLYPFIIRGLIQSDAVAAIGFVTGAVSWLFIIATGVLALLALRQKDQPRGRWAAYVALGAAGSGALGFIASTIGNFFVNFLPYY